MVAPTLSATWLTAPSERLLVVGPSLGTSAAELWQPVASLLPRDVGVLAWDLPGHAGSPTGDDFTLSDLAAGVLSLVEEHAGVTTAFAYAGDSVGGAVGLHLLLDGADRMTGAVLLSTGARIGDPAAWHERAAAVRHGGVAVVVEGSMKRWFSTATTRNHPELLERLTATLLEVDRDGYAQVCHALAAFDVRHRLHEIAAPVLAVAGVEDIPTPPSSLADIADGVRHGRLVVLDDVAHLPPIEAPREVAALLVEHLEVAAGVL